MAGTVSVATELPPVALLYGALDLLAETGRVCEVLKGVTVHGTQTPLMRT